MPRFDTAPVVMRRAREEGRTRYAICLVLLAVVPGCDCFDTCTGGAAFGAITLDDALPPSPESPVFGLRFEKGPGRASKLPDEYYDAGRALWVNGVDGGAGGFAQMTLAETGRLRVVLPRPLGDGVAFATDFPDRVGFLECWHPAGPDRYTLILWLTRLPAGEISDGGYRLETREDFVAGPY